MNLAAVCRILVRIASREIRLEGNSIARLEMLVTLTTMVILDLGYILKLDPIEFVHGLDVKGEKSRICMPLHFKEYLSFKFSAWS